MEKLLSIILVLLLILPEVSYSQKIKVTERDMKMSQGSNNGLTVLIPEIDDKELEKLWKKKMKDFKGKVSNSKGEVFTDDAEIKSISENTVDVYAKLEKEKEGTQFSVWFNLGGAYLNSKEHSAAYKYVENMIQEFAKEAAIYVVEEKLQEEEKILKKLNKDQEKLVSDNEQLKGDIERYKEQIKKAEDDVKKNEEDQAKKKDEIATQSKVVEEVKQKLQKIK